MSKVITTPYMGLPNPVPGQDPGPDYADNLENSLNIIDAHDHSPGNGNVISSSSLNISSDLSFQNNQATGVKAVEFNEQASFTTLNALFVGGDGNLYFNDGVGDPSIKITSGGSVNATSSGISSGNATASFISGVLVVNSDNTNNTPGNVQCRSIFLGKNTPSSPFVSVSPPSSMASNYALILPSVPASGTKIMALDNAGNITAPYIVDGATIAISSNVIGIPNQAITQPLLAPKGVITGSAVAGVGQVGISAVCGPPVGGIGLPGTFTTTSTSDVQVGGLITTITSSSSFRPIRVQLESDGNPGSLIAVENLTSGAVKAYLKIIANSTPVYQTVIQTIEPSSGTAYLAIPSSSISFLDTSGYSTTIYSVYVSLDPFFAGTFTMINTVLVAYEI